MEVTQSKGSVNAFNMLDLAVSIRLAEFKVVKSENAGGLVGQEHIGQPTNQIERGTTTLDSTPMNVCFSRDVSLQIAHTNLSV